MTQQQGQFSYVEAKDVNDIINGIQVVRCQGIWQGTDTSYSSPSTIQYYGLLNQVTQQATIAPGASIIDGIKAQVAKMVANTSYVVRPTAIWVNPIVGDFIDREAKAQQITMNTVEVVGGVKVKALSTQAGELPILSDPFLPSSTSSVYGFGSSDRIPELFLRHPEREPHQPSLHRRRQEQRRHAAAVPTRPGRRLAEEVCGCLL